MDNNQLLEAGRRVCNVEAAAVKLLGESLGAEFCEIAEAIACCQGKVVFTGMGKPGHVNRKMAATFSSLGIPSIALHPGEAMHGDLGMLQKNDLVIAASYSGESSEVVDILALLKRYSSKLIAITGNASSSLAQAADIVQVLPPFEEADPLGLAPTTSTTALMAYGDALAVAISSIRGFTKADFGSYHPAGSLGKKVLYKVDDIMLSGEKDVTVMLGSPLTTAIAEMGRKTLGMACVVDENGNLLGVVTDGDVRRQLERHIDVYGATVDAVMTCKPITIESGSMAIQALRLMRERNVSALPIVDGSRLVGSLPLQAIVDAGIVL